MCTVCSCFVGLFEGFLYVISSLKAKFNSMIPHICAISAFHSNAAKLAIILTPHIQLIFLTYPLVV